MRLLVNLITFSRLLMSPMLILAEPFSVFFYLIYGYCGLSDIVDGWLARKAHIQSPVGAALDGIADIVFFSISAFVWVPRVPIESWQLWWLGTILAIRGVSMLIGLNKYSILIPFLHTNLNKLSGFLLFFMPFLSLIPYPDLLTIPLLAVSSLAVFEEVSIHLLSDHLVRDIPTIFYVNVNNI